MAKTDGSAAFDPNAFLDISASANDTGATTELLKHHDFRGAIIKAFSLPEKDSYVYHAIASVTLAQVQSAINAGAANGLHGWYQDLQGNNIPNPPLVDIEAYIFVFAPGSSPSAALTSFLSNAKKGSLRKDIAEYLKSKRYMDPSLPDPKKKKKPSQVFPANPSFAFWAWSCRVLEWAGPVLQTAKVKTAHHLLPVMMHHFGCVTPSEEALSLLAHVYGNAKKPVVEIGSGNGYWALMLRRRGLDVTAVDIGQSTYRTVWIDDTVREDGVRWLKRNNGARSHALLLVYPITAGDWTAHVLRTYEGSDICVVGTQNQSGYTGFSDCVVDDWMSKEKGDFCKMAQIPLPSFAGKDEALFLFQRKVS